ncbi:SusC/RagA family TonB-linked outer membrane protein [Siansivirga zeaxanthinifaciens]|uniref:Membrane protein n=1 Tax=Siansivirga zeaxanthinifaciens CC-SAMT-1 TaxID=1454006 RepID=A0A0C5VZQ8_9FLAO|nr:TonB-dependent receptor [Siansivirga zeaxanthinifaciens]AJR04536.1 membrane protein [Siansivirga zeaxanthinifaciens CC-SAMT-1]
MKTTKRLLLLVILLPLFSVAQVTIKGKVTDGNNQPIPGVSILVKGTEKGTTTNFDGLYTLSANVNSASILVFSYLGMTSVEEPINGRSTINVMMQESTEALNEIVVIGYGAQQKKDITGSVSQIKSEVLESRSNAQIGSLLQGQATGVEVLANSGKPSAGLSIRIRGTNSITSGSEPLYVVDGVPTTDTRSINPADIESISVLKDASSAAIYGAQGANGVVLITTKRGTTEKPKLTFDTYLGVSQVWNTLPVLNGEQYRDLMTELGQTTDWDRFNQNTDWQQEIFQNGISNNYQLAMSGRNEGSNYYVSAGYTNQEGVVKSSELERFNFKINFDQDINEWLKVGTRIAYTQYKDVDVNDNNAVNQGGVLLGALTTPANIGIFNEDGSFTSNPFQNWENPLASTDGLDREFNSQRFLGNLYFEIKPIKNFTFKTNVGIDNSFGVFDSFLDPFRTGFGRALQGRSINSTNKSSYYIVENTLSYNNTLNNHKIEALIGSVNQKNKFENSYIETRNFASATVTTANGGSEIFGATADKAEKANSSFLGRLNYAYDDKYLVTANFRADGSSVFGPNKRWGYFPSFSLGWRMSQENFLKDSKTLSDLKLRAGWGIVGNDQIQNYAYLGRVGSGANYPIGGVVQPGTFPASIENLELKWEESNQTNVGIDVSLFNNKVNIVADVYIKRTKDLLFDAPLPNATGFTSAIQNIGELENKGIEFSVSTKNINSENFNWDTNFNISFNRNEITRLVDSDVFQGGIAGGRGEAALIREGEPLGILYGYIYGGVDPQTGNAFYLDRNGVSTFTPSADDRTIIGDANPDFTYSLTNNFSYKGFTLMIYLQGSQGNDMLNATRIETEGLIDPKNQSIAVLDRWRQPGDITTIPRAVFGNSDNSRVSTRFIEDASYLRVKALTLGYKFPKNMLDKINLSALRLYVTGENLLTFTDYSGFDPEVNAFGGSNTIRGIDFGTYPQSRTTLFGLSVTF